MSPSGHGFWRTPTVREGVERSTPSLTVGVRQIFKFQVPDAKDTMLVLLGTRNLGPGTMATFADAWTANTFELSLLAAAVFGLLGIALLALGFKVFEWITPKLKVEEELTKGNVAVGIAVGSLLLGISLIIVRAIGG